MNPFSKTSELMTKAGINSGKIFDEADKDRKPPKRRATGRKSSKRAGRTGKKAK